MLLPKRVKYRRVHRGRLKGKAYRGNKVTYGDYGLQALEPAWITSNQIESARIAMTRYIKRGGQVWIYKGEVLKGDAAKAAAQREKLERKNDTRNNDRRRRDDKRDGNNNRRGGNRNFNRDAKREGGNQ